MRCSCDRVFVGAAAIAVLAFAARSDADDTSVQPTTVRTVKFRQDGYVRAEAYGRARRFGLVRRGTRIAVRGEVPGTADDPCRGRRWYAVVPNGFVCAHDVEPTSEAPGGEPALVLRPGRRVPFAYAIVREEALPGYRSAGDVRAQSPAKTYFKGMMLALRGGATVDGVRYARSWDNLLVRQDGIRGMGAGSTWIGERLTPATKLPFGWTRSQRARRWVQLGGQPAADRVPRRTRIDILESRDGFVRTALGWLRDEDVAIVRRIAPPRGVDPRSRWIDVDIGEQVLVAYEGATPVYATLVSTGAGRRTPLGDYPIWAKVASIDMDNQEGDENVYTVQRVPWVLFFQEHNALHGAYWHDRFGTRASHGCVNLAPRDAQIVFDWAFPPLAPGWESYLPPDLAHSVVVHIRDSTRTPEWEQQARIGPPPRPGHHDEEDDEL